MIKINDPNHTIVEAVPGKWNFFLSTIRSPVMGKDYTPSVDNLLNFYGLTKSKIILECVRTTQGKLGYYLINLKDKQFYYCGVSIESVEEKLLDLGIGKIDPMEAN
jgi:hypothetical protein